MICTPDGVDPVDAPIVVVAASRPKDLQTVVAVQVDRDRHQWEPAGLADVGWREQRLDELMMQ